jgi:hypothetical protein
MTSVLTKSAIITCENGDEIEFTEAELETLRSNNTAVITCDGPRCATHHGDKAASFSLNDEAMRKAPDSVPDATFKWFRVGQSQGQGEMVLEFCSPQCNKDWLSYSYVEPLSPRERAAQMKNNSNLGAVSQADGEAN